MRPACHGRKILQRHGAEGDPGLLPEAGFLSVPDGEDPYLRPGTGGGVLDALTVDAGLLLARTARENAGRSMGLLESAPRNAGGWGSAAEIGLGCTFGRRFHEVSANSVYCGQMSQNKMLPGRRAFLRGLGATVALPGLTIGSGPRCCGARSDSDRGSAAHGVSVLPNGVIMDKWRPRIRMISSSTNR